MKIISLKKALGALFLVFVAACSTAADAYRINSINETVSASAHDEIRGATADTQLLLLVPATRNKENFIRYQGNIHSDNNPGFYAAAPAAHKSNSTNQHLIAIDREVNHSYSPSIYLAQSTWRSDEPTLPGALSEFSYIQKNKINTKAACVSRRALPRHLGESPFLTEWLSRFTYAHG